MRNSCTGSFKDKPVITHVFYHPLPVGIQHSVAICTSGITLKISFFFFSLGDFESFSSKEKLSRGFHISLKVLAQPLF